MTPLELVVTKIQRFWRKKLHRREYLKHIIHQYQRSQELARQKAEVHRALIKHQVSLGHEIDGRNYEVLLEAENWIWVRL